MNATIEFTFKMINEIRIARHSCKLFWVTLFDLNLTFTYYKTHTYMLPSSSLEKPFGKVWIHRCY